MEKWSAGTAATAMADNNDGVGCVSFIMVWYGYGMMGKQASTLDEDRTMVSRPSWLGRVLVSWVQVSCHFIFRAVGGNMYVQLVCSSRRRRSRRRRRRLRWLVGWLVN
ncbi:hypothetical protein K504DRAFT_207902 [Pleomassaria siparia CBS 279.74]|uniref:Uncharacterized protein n=1 Tax=Pleomassaria siparia CBS 279.74 TaxID=1314801 RepID=A0A6G1KI98_9PLEO|nr:hypothetical protein K504DRAFT_207902 [Pleomassaria siparia CBS 279.74]